MKIRSLCNAAVFSAAALFSITGIIAAPVDGSHGVDLGLTTDGYIYNATLLTGLAGFPEVDVLGWVTPYSGLANLIVPVGQFTGFTDNGLPIAYLDLIPLTTSSISVVDSAGNNVLNAGPSGTYLSGTVTIEHPQGDISMGIYQ